jgi:hypothetical protein
MKSPVGAGFKPAPSAGLTVKPALPKYYLNPSLKRWDAAIAPSLWCVGRTLHFFGGMAFKLVQGMRLPNIFADGKGLAQKFSDAVVSANLGAEDNGPDFLDIRKAFFSQHTLISLDV